MYYIPECHSMYQWTNCGLHTQSTFDGCPRPGGFGEVLSGQISPFRWKTGYPVQSETYLNVPFSLNIKYISMKCILFYILKCSTTSKAGLQHNLYIERPKITQIGELRMGGHLPRPVELRQTEKGRRCPSSVYILSRGSSCTTPFYSLVLWPVQ